MKHIITTIVCLISVTQCTRAQNNSVYVYGLQSRLTALGHVPRGAGVGYAWSVSRWMAIEANAQVGVSRNHDPVSLIVVDARYNDRTQVSGSLNATAYPIRFDVVGLSNQFGIATGPVVRWKKENFAVAGFPSTISEEEPRFEDAARVAAEWDARGDDYYVIYFYYPGGDSDDYPVLPDGWTDPGYVYGLMQRNTGVDVGWSAGLAYDVSRGRTNVGARADYRRFLDQGPIIGSHTLDLSVRVGYRF